MKKKALFKDLNVSDAFMFAAVMEDEEVCRKVLEVILRRPIGRLQVKVERSTFISPDFRGVRFDAQALEDMGCMMNIEMQTGHKEDLPRRSRLNQGQMDVFSLRPGDKVAKLRPGYVIFICTFDPFWKGKYYYSYTARCHETGENWEMERPGYS